MYSFVCSNRKSCVTFHNIRLWKSLGKMTHFNFKSHCILCLLTLLYWQQNESMFKFDWHSDCLCFCSVCVCVLGNKTSANTASRDLFLCWQKRRSMWWLLWSKSWFKEVLSVDGLLFLLTRTCSKIFHPLASLVLPY